MAERNLRVTSSRSGHPTLAVDDRLLHSSYDPVKEARREVAEAVAARPRVLILLGMGLGYAAEAALAMAPESKVIVVEADEAIYRCARATRALPQDPRLTWAVGRNEAALFEALSFSIDALDAGSIRYVTRLAELDADHYGRVVDLVGRIASMHAESLGSMARLGPLWWENSVRNALAWVGRPEVGAWTSPALTGQPVVVFAAGPTLGDHLERFAGRDGGVRFAVDTACERVHAAGVRVDAVFSIDAQAQTLDHFARVRPRRLIASPVVPPALWDRAEQSWITSLDGPHFDWWDGVSRRRVGRLKSGGSVTTFAFDLARRMRACAIVLVGADFANRGRHRHVPGTTYEASGLRRLARFRSLEHLERRGACEKDGFSTEPVLAQYAQWMEWEIAATSCPVRRMADFGLLRHVPVATERELAGWLDRPAPAMPAGERGDADGERALASIRSALAAERRALDRVLAAGCGRIEPILELSGFFDLLVRPAVVAAARDGMSPDVRDFLEGNLRRAADVLDEVLAGAAGGRA